MADGRTKPISDIRAGDHVYGTELRGAHRSLIRTDVLDHWPTVKPGHRITLDDGTGITASAEHRFLTDRGWRHVSALEAGHRLVSPPTDGVQTRGSGSARLHTVVIDVVPMRGELPMYDITTGTGDFIANGVVSHNCFARPTHEYLGLNIGEDFDRRIVVKINAVERLRAELADPRWAGESVAMGTNTDPYQRAEAKYRLTRGVVEALAERGNPFSILTKSPLVTRDLDLIAEAAKRADVRVNFSLGTLDQRVWRATEPGAPDPRRRVDAIRRLAERGVRTGALIAPVLPGLSDSEPQLRAVVAAVREAGGEILGLGPLHLRRGTREHFLAWLASHDPDLHADYLRRYATSDYAPERYLDTLYARAGLSRRRPAKGPA